MNSWTWHPATGLDVPAIVAMAQAHFESEIDEIFCPDPIAYACNITLAIVAQFYNSGTELVSVAKDSDTQAIVAYLWVIRGQKTPWSNQEMIMPRMVHVDMALPLRQRLRLVREMMTIWETWAQHCGVNIVCSTTMRRDTAGFLRLHEQAGYDCRGSFAYKRLVNESAQLSKHPVDSQSQHLPSSSST